MTIQHPTMQVRREADKDAKLYAIERALKFDPDHVYRRQLVREFLDLTDPIPEEGTQQ